MTTRHHYIPDFVTGILLAWVSIGTAQAQPAATAEAERSWHSRSLTTETVTGPNGRHHHPHGARRQPAARRHGIESRRAGLRGSLCPTWLGYCTQLRHRGAGRVDRRRHRRLHSGRRGNARDARTRGRQEDPGRRHPAHPLALRRRHRRVAGRGDGNLGAPAPGPQPRRLGRYQRAGRCLAVAGDGAVRRVPSGKWPRRVSQPAEFYARKIPGGIQLPAADEALRGRQGRRPRDRRRADPGRAASYRRDGQRRVLFPAAPPARLQLSGRRYHLQHLHVAWRHVSESRDPGQRRPLGRIQERGNAVRYPRADAPGREGGAGGGRAPRSTRCSSCTTRPCA